MLKSFLKRSLIVALPLVATVTTVQADHHGSKADMKALKSAIANRPAEDLARDKYRNPMQTLEFFQVKPGMSVVEALPGGGWYSKILAPYLGGDGALHGVNYPDKVWSMFGFMSEERIAQLIEGTAKFPGLVAGFTDNGIDSTGFTFDNVPVSVEGKVDRVLFVRALHNLSRFEEQGGTLTQALAATKSMLKADGMVGVVQHRAPESASDESAKGQRGYLKQSFVIQVMEEAGFKLVASSEINSNANDTPSDSDIVWRLPPSLNGVGDNEALRKERMAIGESDRMTLLFKLAD